MRVLEKRGDAREAPPRRKPVARHGDGSEDPPEVSAEDRDAMEEAGENRGSGAPKHALDDLA
jgi:hypothetical protein